MFPAGFRIVATPNMVYILQSIKNLSKIRIIYMLIPSTL
jgi:hypothetical protein